MRNQLKELARSVSSVEIILSLLKKEEKTGYQIAKEHNKPLQQHLYRSIHLPKLARRGLLNIKRIGNKKYYSLNYDKFWDIFFEFYSDYINRNPNNKEKEILTKFLLNPNMTNHLENIKNEPFEKNDLYMLFNSIFLKLFFVFLFCNFGSELEEFLNSMKNEIRTGRQLGKALEEFVEKGYGVIDSKSFRDDMDNVYHNALKGIFKEIE